MAKTPKEGGRVFTGADACNAGRHHWILREEPQKRGKPKVVTGCARCPAVRK